MGMGHRRYTTAAWILCRGDIAIGTPYCRNIPHIAYMCSLDPNKLQMSITVLWKQVYYLVIETSLLPSYITYCIVYSFYGYME